MNATGYINGIENGRFNEVFDRLYRPENVPSQKKRYISMINKFSSLYPERDEIKVYSAPGRTEIGGNHTDHQNGCVVAGAADLDIIAAAAFHDEGVIRVISEGYEPFYVSLGELKPRHAERRGAAAIVRGIASRFVEMGVEIRGFDMYLTSDIPTGSGLSSSAAFEMLIAYVIDSYYNENRSGPAENAKIGQYAENVYFGKNSGLMDQMACSSGGLVYIDFENPTEPEVKKIDFDLKTTGYDIIITDTRGSHADLTAEYDAVRKEMSSVAGYFGKSVLRDISESVFWSNLSDMRGEISDRAILRAAHFFDENRRAKEEFAALSENRFGDFLKLVNSSGQSSAELLQNLYSCKVPEEQAVTIAIAAGRRALKGRGAVRVHGGGFAGTIQAFVPAELTPHYRGQMDNIFGINSCHILTIRPVGCAELVFEKP